MNGPNWGIIGAGFIATQFVKDYAHVNDGRITAIASRSKKKAESFANEYGIEKAYEGYDRLMEDKEIDAVYIATPHNLHYENTLSAIKNNKAVLCEKPAAVNMDQLKEMIGLARKNNVLFMEAMWTYLLPAVAEAKKWISSGEIGEITLIQADFGVFMDFPPEHRINNPHLAGGGLLDLGIYPVALTNLMIDEEIQNIQAMAHFGDTQVDETTVMHLNYKNNAIAQLICSTKNPTAHDAHIYGTRGRIYLPHFWKARNATLTTPLKESGYKDTRESIGYNYEIEEMNKLIKQNAKESNHVPYSISLRNMETLDHIRKEIKLKYPFE
ncbi:MAG: Gfo/Idh/MocA family oxidoreductase [Bacteroidales bacterium]|nr:Gfo/Idh/MocA family oxidoreductase [Bacteroidales bacterium]MBS3774226.1 Gfo/Idh/MocA family oxidoreductase [Bacteroidales bacterium]